MKILQVINTLSVGGAEKLVVDIAKVLNKDKNIQCDILILCDNLKENYHKELIGSSTKVFNLNVKWIYNPISIFKMIKIIKNYDIIHSHLFPSQYWVALSSLFIKNHDILFLTTEHNTHNRRRDFSFFKPIDRLIYSCYDRIICISEGTLNSLNDYLENFKNIYIVNNGVDLDRFTKAKALSRSSFNILPNDIVLIMVAGFRPQKDQDTIIRSLLLLPDNVKLVLVGDGERKTICEKITLDLGLEDRVIFTGVRYDVERLLKMSDVSIVSSHWEGFGLVAVEGMAAGLPVIASDVSGLREVVSNAGLLFMAGDENDLADKVRKLLNNSSLYNEVKSKCYLRSKKFSIDSMVDKTINLYCSLQKVKLFNK